MELRRLAPVLMAPKATACTASSETPAWILS